MKTIITCIFLFVGGRLCSQVNYQFTDKGIDYYALTYHNAQTIEYWARKGIYSDSLIKDMDQSITWHQANAIIILDKLNQCVELNKAQMAIATSSTEAAMLWRSKYNMEHMKLLQLNKYAKKGVYVGAGVILILSLITVIK